MKKATLTTFFLSIFLIGQSQTIPTNKETGEYEYSSVISIPSVTSDNLYYAGRIWLLTTFTSEDNMMQINDPEKKMLISSGNLNLDPRPDMANCSINFKVRLEFKDGKCKYTISNFWHRYFQAGMAEIRSSLKLIRTNNWDGIPVKQAIQDKIKEEINSKITALLGNLEVALKKTGDKEW